MARPTTTGSRSHGRRVTLRKGKHMTLTLTDVHAVFSDVPCVGSRSVFADGQEVVVARGYDFGGALTCHAPTLFVDGVTWTYNGGAGGTFTGVWLTVADVREWLKANGDALGVD